jgi:uncharacterized protein (TIGR02266 family)
MATQGYTGFSRMDHVKEKRRDPRVPLVLRVGYPGQPLGTLDSTENLSSGGLFIRTERDLAIGQRIPLILSFPALLDPVEMEVEVVRVRADPSEGPPGVAVKVLSEPDQGKIAQLLELASRPPPRRRTFHVLVVEDNPHVLEMYEYALKKLRTQEGAIRVVVEYAGNGHDALRRLGNAPRPDLVISDLFMPVMDGFALVGEMRRDAALVQVPVLMISAGGGDARSRALDAGVDVYLEKPVQFSDVIGTVRMLLAIRG